MVFKNILKNKAVRRIKSRSVKNNEKRGKSNRMGGGFLRWQKEKIQGGWLHFPFRK